MAECGKSTVRTDLLSEELATPQQKITIIAETAYNNIVNNAEKLEKTRTPGQSKNILEVMDLIKSAVEDYEQRVHSTNDSKIHITYEEPDKLTDLEALTIKLIRREPGMFGKGTAFENKTRQLRPLLREEIDDPENPGYKRAVLGQWYDNILRLTCWARTNKAANDRSLWLENVMEEYAWFFVYSGVNRVLYNQRGPEETITVDQSRMYGRCLDYFVRTEKIVTVSQKELECIVVRQNTVANFSTDLS
jgi:hypothetical protein